MKIPWNKRYLSMGITAFAVIACSILFYVFLRNISVVASFLGKINAILMPVTMGFVIAYLLNPVLNFFENKCFRPLVDKMKWKKAPKSLPRFLGIFATLTVAVAVVAVLLSMVVPQLFVSIAGMIEKMPGYFNSLKEYVTDLVKSNPDLSAFIDDQFDMIMKYLQATFDKLTPYLNDFLGNVTQGVLGFLNATKNLLIGLIVSIYIMAAKEKFLAQAKKVVVAIFPQRMAGKLMRTTLKTHRIFGGFISGKLLDSMIVGILCFICISIFKCPYALLVSVMIGVTNIIPFFGPFIGAIPSALIIFLEDPMKALIFVIVIIVLQQIDGNIIGPKILGESTGLSAFWVIFSILLFGGLFGFLGMFVGVPAFAVIYTIVSSLLEDRLEKKGLPTQTDAYGPEQNPVPAPAGPEDGTAEA